ncbi:MAG: hypothetical protein ACJATT_003417 [Myxococcota bacterium]|jgi:hypothetical protein
MILLMQGDFSTSRKSEISAGVWAAAGRVFGGVMGMIRHVFIKRRLSEGKIGHLASSFDVERLKREALNAPSQQTTSTHDASHES